MTSNQSAIQTQTDTTAKKSVFSRGSTLVGVGLVSMLVITGCGKGADKAAETEQKTSEGDAKTSGEGVTLEPVGPDAAEVCGDAQLAGSLKEALVNTIMTQSKTFAAAHAQSANIIVNSDNVGSAASNVVVDVQNIQSANEAPTSSGMVTCQASVSMKLPSDDITRADAMYIAANESNLQQKLAEAKITLNDGMIVDEQFRFVVNPQSASPAAQIIGQPAALKVVADVMANSSVKSQIDAQAAARKAAAAKKAREQAAARKAAAEKKARQQAAARKAAAEKKAREQAAARKAAAEKKAREQAAARKAAAEKKAQQANQNLSLERDGMPKNNANNAKPTAPSKPKQPTQKADEKLNVKGADQIEMVIVEEEGTY